MDKNNVYISIGIFIIFILFFLTYIYPLPTHVADLESSITLNELNKECSSDIGMLAKTLNKNVNSLCSNFSKVYYCFIFVGILSIILVIFSIVNLNK